MPGNEDSKMTKGNFIRPLHQTPVGLAFSVGFPRLMSRLLLLALQHRPKLRSSDNMSRRRRTLFLLLFYTLSCVAHRFQPVFRYQRSKSTLITTQITLCT